MRVWLELNQKEGELLFDLVKDFSVDRMKTAVMGAPKDEQPETEVSGASMVKKEKDSPAETEKAEAAAKSSSTERIPIEKVRAVLEAKSRAGKQEQVRALIVKYGSNNLTGIDPSRYADLLAEGEAL